MAAPPPSDKVKDKEYANWLKVTLALYYMKLGLHTFIKNEIDYLHQSLKQKVYGPTNPSSLPPCTTCLASHVNRNKYTRVWEFRKQCKSYCDVWLYELLLLHTNPKSEKIYWDNSIVTEWKSKPWECAKVFMPRGQPSSNTGPAECDAQALLTLLANCKHFHLKFSSQGHGLLNTISVIRNKIIHDGEMKLSDADRMKFIQEIIQFLEDPVSLKSEADCQLSVSNIHKIDTDSLDIFFSLDNEMKALRTAVDELKLELGMEVKKAALNTADSLKEEYKQLKEKLKKRFDDFKKEFDTKLQELKTNTDTELQQHKKKNEEIHTTVTHLSSKLSTLEEIVQANKLTQQGTNSGRSRNVAGEGMLDHDSSEVTTRRRPESDGLRPLKNQTEDRIDTLRKLECIQTKQADKAKTLLEGKGSVVIRGNPGEGKTITAFHLIDNEMYRDRRVVLYSPRHWEEVDTDWIDIVVLEDIFGQFDLDPSRLQEWMVHLPTIQEHVDAGKLRVIITTRVDILLKAYSRIGSIQIFSDDLSLTLSSEQLNHSEKMSILNRELCRHGKDMKEDEKVICITNFRGLIGFPQCCSLFAMDSKLFDRGPGFFKSPENFFVGNISNLEHTRFLALAFLFCNGEILEEYLSSATMPESSKCLLMDLASNLNISKKMASITLLRDAYNSFFKLYVVKTMSYQFEKPCICFTHATVCEAVGQVFGDLCPEMVVKHGNSEYLYQKTYTADVKDSTSQNVFIPVYVYGLLAERMVHDILEGGLVRSVVKHSALNQHDFLMKLKDELHKGNKIMDFFMAKPYCISILDHDLSNGKCITFMQYILQGKEDIVRLVYNEFLEFLACHSNKSSDCWQCEEKQKLLELALYYHHFQIADELLTMNATYTHVSLCNAARHGDLKRVQTILETLKSSQDFNPRCEEANNALCRSIISGRQQVLETLLKHWMKQNSCHVVDAVQQEDMIVDECSLQVQDQVSLTMKNLLHVVYSASFGSVKETIQHLKDTGNWDPKCFDASKALELCYCYQNYDVCGLLVQEGVSLTMNNLVHVLHNLSLDPIKKEIQHLKDNDNLDSKFDYAMEALKVAHYQYKRDVCDLLAKAGISLTPRNFLHVMCSLPLESVKKVIEHLKDTDNWDPMCDDASEAFKEACHQKNTDVCDLFLQEGISLATKKSS